jgi:hypothetical protein
MHQETPRLMASTPRLHRLAYYLIGLAIGLMMVGVIVSLRSQYMHQPQAQAPNAGGVGGAGGAGGAGGSGGSGGSTGAPATNRP